MNINDEIRIETDDLILKEIRNLTFDEFVEWLSESTNQNYQSSFLSSFVRRDHYQAMLHLEQIVMDSMKSDMQEKAIDIVYERRGKMKRETG